MLSLLLTGKSVVTESVYISVRIRDKAQGESVDVGVFCTVDPGGGDFLRCGQLYSGKHAEPGAMFLSGSGIVNCNFEIPVMLNQIAGAGLVLFAFGTVLMMALRVKKIPPEKLLADAWIPPAYYEALLYSYVYITGSLTNYHDSA